MQRAIISILSVSSVGSSFYTALGVLVSVGAEQFAISVFQVLLMLQPMPQELVLRPRIQGRQ